MGAEGLGRSTRKASGIISQGSDSVELAKREFEESMRRKVVQKTGFCPPRGERGKTREKIREGSCTCREGA